MKCEQFEKHVNDLLDRRINLQLDGQVDEHLRECDACKELLRYYSSFAQLGENPSKETIDVKARSGHSKVHPGFWKVAACAALLLVILSPFHVGTFNQHSDDTKVAKAGSMPQNALQPQTADFVPKENKAHNSPNSSDNHQKSEAQKAQIQELKEMGKSINLVWEKIKEDEYLIPIIGQGALFFVRGT